jgi:NADPH:quinone reductase-like Zn-dependent oxidoreductase
MRALAISAHGGLEQVEHRTDLPVPAPAPGWVRVKMRAAALNHVDLFVIRGIPGVNIKPPWIIGADGAGVLDAAGSGATLPHGVREGDRVLLNPGFATRDDEYVRRGDEPLSPSFGLLGEHHPGAYAEYVCLPAKCVRPVPADVTDDIGAAFTTVTLTAWRMVVTRARVTADDEVLIWGIGGGVALAALAICKSIGARVWVTSSSDEKLAKARALGADETLNHTQVEVGREIRSRTGKRGATVVLDSIGTATWKQSLVALGRGGRLVTCGGTSGPLVETDVRRMFWNQWTLMGSTMGSEAEFDAIVAELAAGRLMPVIDSRFPLERGRDALERLASGAQFGKIVLDIAS